MPLDAHHKEVIDDFIKLTKLINERVTQLLMKASLLRGSDRQMGDKMEQIIQSVADVSKMIRQAKILAEGIQGIYANPAVGASVEMKTALDRKCQLLDSQSTRLSNIDRQLLAKLPKAPTVDPAQISIQSFPTAPTTNPMIGALVKETLDKLQQRMQDVGSLSRVERRAIVMHATNQLLNVEDKIEFNRIMKEEITMRNRDNKEREIAILQTITPPTDDEVAMGSTAPSAVVSASESPQHPFDEMVQEIANLSTFDEVKCEIFKRATDPDERFKLIVAVKEEIQNRKLIGQLPEPVNEDLERKTTP